MRGARLDRRPLVGVLLLALAGCSLSLDRARPGDDARGPLPEGGLPPDGPRSEASLPDGPAAPPPPSTSALQVIFNRFLLPTHSGDHALDLDGDGSVDNQLGAIFAVVATAMGDAFDLQQNADRGINEGKTLFMLDLFADSLATSRARLRAHIGKDLDGDASDNFSGDEQFELDPDSPADVALDGKIASGQLSATGAVVMPFVASGGLLMLPLSKARIEAKVDATGMRNGILAGAMPMKAVEETFIAEIATRVDHTYKSANTSSKEREQLRDLFDGNKDGTITAKELAESPVVGILFKPDVDTNDDGTADAMSLGFGFTAVPCRIKQ